jgi:CspA family cold shock protein
MASAPSLDSASFVKLDPSQDAARASQDAVGVVKFFSVARGYGFLRPDGDDTESGDDVFFHHSELRDENLSAGDQVRFALIDSPRGRQALSVERLPVEKLPAP